MSSALGYVEETLLNAEVVKLLPKPLAPVVGGLLSRSLNSHKTFFKCLIPIAEQRIQEQDNKRLGHPVPRHVSAHKRVVGCSVNTANFPLVNKHRPTVSSGSSRQPQSRTRGQRSVSSMS